MEVPQLMLPTTEDREDLASAHRAAQEEEVVQLLHEQQQIVVTTDAVSEDATDATSAQEAEWCRRPTSVSESGRAQVENAQPQVRQFNWSPNQALTMVVPVWVGHRKIMAIVDTAAQVTLINQRLSQELGCDDPVEWLQLRNAQMDSWMDGGSTLVFSWVDKSIFGMSSKQTVKWSRNSGELGVTAQEHLSSAKDYKVC